MKHIFVLIMLILALPFVQAEECEEVKGQLDIEKHVLGCLVLKKGARLNCRNHFISGSKKMGNGITVEGDDVEVLNCVVQNFETGLVSDGYSGLSVSNSIFRNNNIGLFFNKADVGLENVEISENSFYGVYAKDSEVEEDHMLYKRNGQDRLFVKKTEEVKEEKKEVKEEEPMGELKEIPVETITEIPERVPLIEAQIKEANKKIKLSKQVTYHEDKTIYTIFLEAKEEVHNLYVYEVIPKELAESVENIHSIYEFEVVEEDPIIRFEIGEIESGNVEVITYTIDKSLLGKTISPSTILALEESLNPGGMWWMRVLFSLFLLLFVIHVTMKQMWRVKPNYARDLIIFGVGVFLFMVFNVKIEIAITRPILTFFVNFLFFAAFVYLGYEVIELYKKRKRIF